MVSLAFVVVSFVFLPEAAWPPLYVPVTVSTATVIELPRSRVTTTRLSH